MKKSIFVVVLLLISISFYAQAPEKVNYQAVARNLTGAPLINQTINVKYEVRQGSSTGTIVYAENHVLTTNQFGLFTAEIGGGVVITGSFPGIAWGTSPFYLYVEVDGDPMGVTQLLSVPYALYAKESGNGPAGLPGKNSLSVSSAYSGPLCSANGGNQIEVGLDDNNDGILQALEIDYTYYVCNGTDGVIGSDGLNTLSSTVASTSCPNGGVTVNMGLDANNNSVLDVSEISLSYDVCNGIDGIAGTNGIDGLNTIAETIPSTSCPNGGVTVNMGLDTNNNGILEAVEITTTYDVCNGTSGTTYFAGNGISLSGDTITNTGDADSDPTNEIQVLSISNDTIFLSNGGFAPLPSAGGYWIANGNDIYNSNTENVGIGTNTPPQKLSVLSNDSIIAGFLGTNPQVSAIAVANTNLGAATGIIFYNGTDTSSFIFLDPTSKNFTIHNKTIGGNIILNTEKAIVNQSEVLTNEIQDLIYNRTDTIFNQSPSGTIIHVNQGSFLTDSLYVLGANAANINWILANDGTGQARWTDPSTIISGTADNWGTDVVNTAGTNIAGDGTAGNPLTVTESTSTLVDNLDGTFTYTDETGSPITFDANIDDADADATNELQVLSFSNDTLYLSNGNSVVLPPKDSTNIYNSNGTLTGARTVTQNANNITYVGGGINPTAIFRNGNALGAKIQIDATNAGASPSVNLTNNATNWGGISGTANGLQLNGGTGGNVGVGVSPANGKFVVQHAATSAYPSIKLNQTDLNLNRIHFTNTAVANKYWEIAAETDASDINSGYSINYFNGTTYNIHFLTYGNGRSAINGSGFVPAPNNSMFDVFGTTTLHDSLTIRTSYGSAYTFPVADGSPNFLMQTDGSGNLSWLDPSSLGNSWSLTGNGGTNPATNFIGTTDAQDFRIRTNNTNRLTITQTGNVGIGMLNPNYLFHIQDSSASAGEILLKIEDNIGIPLLTINNDRFIGVNNGTPSASLDIYGTLKYNYSGTINPGDVLTAIDNQGNADWQPPSASANYWSLNGLDIFNNNTGNVGIGTTTPGALLDIQSQVNTTSDLFQVRDNIAGVALRFSRSAITLLGAVGGGFAIQSPSNDIVFSTDSPLTEKMRIQLNGNVGIGTTTPIALLHLEKDSSTTMLIKENIPTNGSALIMESNQQYMLISNENGFFRIQNNTSSNSPFNITSTGRVGINGDAQYSELDVYGKITMRTGAVNGYIPVADGNGTMTWTDPTTLGLGGAWTSNGTETYLNSLNDKVGIGLNNPSEELHIIDNISLRPQILLETTSGNFAIGYRYKTALAEWFMGQEEAAGQQFRIKDVFNNKVTMAISPSTGNVGIGTTTPKSILTVNGDIGLNDGATVASNNAVTILLTNSGPALNAGDIVVVGTDNSFTTTNTNANYAVIGVAIEGIGNGSVGKIAISGVVTVNTVAGVTRGQHCITSATAGRAMGISTPSAGTSIGVYLTNETAGTAKVLLR